MMDKDVLWDKTLASLLDGVEENDLKSVFLNFLTPFGIFDDSFILIAPYDQVEAWVKKNYLAEIEKTVEEIYKEHLKVVIGADSDSSNDEKQSSADIKTLAEEKESKPEWLDTYVPAPNSESIKEPFDDRKERLRRSWQQNMDSKNQALFTKCTFESFVVGPSNEFARGAAIAVAEQPGIAYNPLFIYGNSGLGKTHLLVAIANYVIQNFPEMLTLYVSANDFLKDFVQATQKNQWGEFNSKYHEADVLLIDDVQYLENKDETINQLFNIFNEMTGKSKQIVLSADRAPKDMNMDERMRSRFASGLLTDIKPPDYETRLAILRNFLSRVDRQMGFYGIIPDDVLEYLAQAATSNIREIEGAITRIISNMSLLRRDSIDVEEAKELLTDFFPDLENRKIEISSIMNEVERFYGVSHEDMVSSKRQKEITNPRHVAIYLSRYLTEESLEAIGKKFGGRDHTTVMHSVNKIEREQKNNKVLFDQLEELTRQIKRKY